MRQSTVEALHRLSETPDPGEARAVSQELLAQLGATATEYTGLVDALVARVEELAELRRLAGTDPLTHAVNRRAFLEALERELARSTRGGTHVAVLLLDLDGFKALNDELGHLVGDCALTEAARALEGAVRAADLVARLGGDEFAILLPLDEPSVAEAIVQRVRAAVEAVWVEDRKLRASIGCGSTATTARDARSLLLAADRALYADKRRRRESARQAA